MKYYSFLIAFILGFTCCVKANNNDVFYNLTSINAEWPKQPDCMQVVATANIGNPTNYTAWIATHLMLVEQTLRGRDVSYLNNEQKNNRNRLLDELHGYWQAGVFPQNTYVNYKTPVFIDAVGTHCAVGYLMQQSGSDELAQRINRNEKFAYVHQIKTDGVKQWADKNGFTIDELAWIQPAYVAQHLDDMHLGVNGDVNALALDTINDILYVGGTFAQSGDGVAGNNILAWVNDISGHHWINLGSGLSSTVYSLVLHDGKLFAGGDFLVADTSIVNGVAVFDVVSSQWQPLGAGLDSTVRVLKFYNGDLYAGGDFTGGLSRWNDTIWQDVSGGHIKGSVRALTVWNNQLAIGGDFNLLAPLSGYHIAAYDGVQVKAVVSNPPTPVNDLAAVSDTLYAACNVVAGNYSEAFMSFDTTTHTWQSRMNSNMTFTANSINHIELYPNSDQMVLTGDFDITVNLGDVYTSRNTTLYSPYLYGTTNFFIPIRLVADGTIYTSAITSDGIYFGGAFTHNLDTVLHVSDINHITYFYSTTGTAINELSDVELPISIFPNPATDAVYITTTDKTDLQRIDVYDVTGKMVLSQNTSSSTATLSLSGIAPGIYTIHTLTNNGWGAAKLVKQ